MEGWKDGRMVEVDGGCPLGGLDGRLMRRWVDGSLSLDEAKVGVSVAEAAETLVGLFRWWVEGGPAKPSQVKKVTLVLMWEAAKKVICVKVVSRCLGEEMVVGPFQPVVGPTVIFGSSLTSPHLTL